MSQGGNIMIILPEVVIHLILHYLPLTLSRQINCQWQHNTRPLFLRTCFATVFESYWNTILETKDEFEYVREEIMSLWWADLMHSDIWKQFPDLIHELKKDDNLIK